MRKISISQEMYNFLKDHIAQMEKEQNSLMREHYPETTDESIEIKELFRNYTTAIADYLDSVKVSAGNSDTCPFVIINSTVEVQDTEDMDVYQYRIVLPYSKNTDMGIDCATCLSPLGRELLLKAVNQKANIQIPTGTLHYVVKRITLPEQAAIKNSSKQFENESGKQSADLPDKQITSEAKSSPNIGLPM